MKNFISVLTIVLCFNIISLPQKDARTIPHLTVPKVNEPNISIPTFNNLPSPSQNNAVLITKMWNAYTTQGSYTNQIYFDPFSNTLAVVHRSDRTGLSSGHIVYQLSDDLGANWSGQIGPANPNSPIDVGRHPNIALSNKTNSSSLDDLAISLGVAGLGQSWRYAAMLTDTSISPPIFLVHYDSVFNPGEEMTTDNHGNIYAIWSTAEPWLGDTSAKNVLFRSDDRGLNWQKAGIDKASNYNTDFNGMKIEFGTGDVGFIMVEAQNPSTGSYDFGLKKTTNSGQSWDANWSWVNWRNAQYGNGTLGDSVHALNYEVDLIVHGVDHPFLGGTFVDTTDGTATGVYVVSNTGSGWKADLIKIVNTTLHQLPGGLFTLNEVEFSRNITGSYIFIKLIDVPAIGDTSPDIYVRLYYSGAWTSLMNASNTPNIKEKYSQMASRFFYESVFVKIFIMYTLFGDNDQSDLAEAELWLNPYPYTDVKDDENLFQFNLENNYPNPFNPQTSIKFDIGRRTIASLKVYDILGKEVTTLLEKELTQGSYSVNWEARDSNGRLLPSGVYFIRLASEKYSKTIKAILMR